MTFIKKNIVLITAFALPVLLVLWIAVSTYLPSLLLSTQYNFVYATCDTGSGYYGYNCENYLTSRYGVENGKLVVREVPPTQDSDRDKVADINENYITRLFLHDTKANEGREITLAEAQNLNLRELLTSPDGVSVESGYNRGAEFFFLFDSSSEHHYYLTKGKKHKQLNLVNDEERYYYRENFKFIGWVIK